MPTITAIYPVFVGLYIIGFLICDGYEILKRTGRIDSGDNRILALVFTSMTVAWISWFGIGLADPTRLPVPAILRWISLSIVILGSGLVFGGMWQLKGVENIDHLVTNGLFSKIRHPIYVGYILWTIGLSAYQGAFLSLAIGTLGIISVVWWRFLEEKDMRSHYDTVYLDYRAKTWF